MAFVAVAIDGPAGAGKSTAARAAAKELGFIYVDTGALYRAIGLHAVEQGFDTTDADALEANLSGIDVQLRFVDGEQRVFLNGRDVSAEIRRPDMGLAASNVSAQPAVRAFLLDLQRELARRNDVVMDGRDIATVVLPDAQVKIFLTASAEDRAARRYEEHLAKGEQVSYNTILAEINQRDYNDQNRAIAPLRVAEGAVLLDNSGFSPTETRNAIIEIIKDHLQ